MQNIKELVFSALAATLKIHDLQKITITDKLKEDLGLDSMTSLIFLMKLEETVPGFFIDPETLDSDALATVASVIEYVEARLNPERQVA